MDIKELIIPELPIALDVLEIKYSVIGGTYTVNKNNIKNIDNIKIFLNKVREVKHEIIIKPYKTKNTLFKIRIFNKCFIRVIINSNNFDLIYK